MRGLVILILVCISSFVPEGGLAAQVAAGNSTEKIRGWAFYGPKEAAISPVIFDSITASGADWIAVVPEITLNRYTLHFQPDSLNHHWGETLEAAIQTIILAKQSGLKVMLKPHMVLVKKDAADEQQREMRVAEAAHNGSESLKERTRGADWRGTFYPVNRSDRSLWEANYRQYILQWAKIAEVLSVEIFCVGTELKRSAIRNPAYWRELIEAVRPIYHGLVTYSANWDEYDRIEFWEDLDMIGVNTYFPVNHRKKPGIARTKKNWRPIRSKLEQFAAEHDRKVLFTEFGYRNTLYAGRRPWEHDEGRAQRFDRAQYNLYEAFFRTFWAQDWVLGGFSWKWFADVPPAGNTTFSTQGKPAFEVIRRWYRVP